MAKVPQCNFSILDNPYFARQRNKIRLNLCGDDGAFLYPAAKMYADTAIKTEDQMDRFLLGSLMKKPNVNIEKLKDLSICNFEQIEKNAFRGETLFCKKQHYLKALKEAGIERIIDLRRFDGYEEECKKNGLEYFGFEAYSIDCINNPKTYINGAINLVKTIQKGNYYIGCSFGTVATDYALLLNEFFNPKCKLISKVSIKDNGLHLDYLRMIEITAKRLDNDDKQALGWTPEFEKKFYERIESELARLRKRQ